MMRLGLAMGARLETFTGLSGVGDLNLCSNSPSSRNMSLGIALGAGRKLQDVLAERVTVQEGVHSAESVAALARSHSLAMPIAMAVDQVLNHDADIDETIARLLSRPYGLERVSAVLA
jgi:glycerol-3-phosphate dehydrogenase (NAD(P)+)